MRASTRSFVRSTFLAAAALGSTTACIPYTVGSTAQTAPVGESTIAGSYYFMPNAIRIGDTLAAPLWGVDHEWRHGMDDHSDAGFRLTPGGALVSYKRRFADYAPGQPALAFMVGGGVVNWGDHAEVDATLIASGNELAGVMPFGGLRAIQVIPITRGAVSDSPTIGGFGGIQLGDAAFSIRPELGVYYDLSALGLRRNRVILIPAVTLARGRGHTAAAATSSDSRTRTVQKPATTRGGLVCNLLGVCREPPCAPGSTLCN